MTITSYYKHLVSTDFLVDPLQEKIVAQLQIIQDKLIKEFNDRQGFRLLRKSRLVKGMYLWGGVGAGKTFLLDCFYESLPLPSKSRMHFFQFMRFIHTELNKLKGKKNPLQLIAKQLTEKVIVLCFDEFFVTDIVDAMLLGQLLQSLFKEGICIVTTSNISPEKLYYRGLQRGNFLPAIAALQKHLAVIHLSSETDYRLRTLTQHGIFFTPHDQKAEQEMQHIFKVVSHAQPILNAPITFANRLIHIKQEANDAIWFLFNKICHVPRSHQDYLFLAEHYQYIFMSDIPAIEADEKNTIRLFISLIDVLYDHRCKLIFSAKVEIKKIYTTGEMLFQFQRTASRLIEMQSVEYFNTPWSRQKAL